MRVSLIPDLDLGLLVSRLSLVECDDPVWWGERGGGAGGMAADSVAPEACRSLMHLVSWLHFIGGFIRIHAHYFA